MHTEFHISVMAQAWLEHGERGISSETIFSHLTGLKIRGDYSHPADPSDLLRCRKLLLAVPEFQHQFHRMSELSPTWHALVEHWETLCKMLDVECPTWSGTAANTYKRMKELGC